MEFKDLTNRAMQLKALYDKYNNSTSGKIWSREQMAQGLVGDVGDLIKLIMAKEGARQIENVDDKLAHELSDCLWSIIVLAELYDVELESSFMKTMDELETYVESKLSQK